LEVQIIREIWLIRESEIDIDLLAGFGSCDLWGAGVHTEVYAVVRV